jgi:hypothetical protein
MMISFFIPEFSSPRVGDLQVATSGGLWVAVRYVELVREIIHEPAYGAALKAVKECVG